MYFSLKTPYLYYAIDSLNSRPKALQLITEQSFANTHIFSIKTSQPSYTQKHGIVLHLEGILKSKLTKKKKKHNTAKIWQEIDHKKDNFFIVWQLKQKVRASAQLGMCASQIFTILFISVNDYESAKSIDFRVTNKLQ